MKASNEGDLRKTGFSKDGKHSNQQIFLGLLVALGGYAIGYDIFEGNIFEGHTLIPVIEKKQEIQSVKTNSGGRCRAFEQDEYNGMKGLQRLEKQRKSGTLSKKNINNRGYNKFLKMQVK